MASICLPSCFCIVSFFCLGCCCLLRLPPPPTDQCSPSTPSIQPIYCWLLLLCAVLSERAAYVCGWPGGPCFGSGLEVNVLGWLRRGSVLPLVSTTIWSTLPTERGGRAAEEVLCFASTLRGSGRFVNHKGVPGTGRSVDLFSPSQRVQPLATAFTDAAGGRIATAVLRPPSPSLACGWPDWTVVDRHRSKGGAKTVTASGR